MQSDENKKAAHCKATKRWRLANKDKVRNMNRAWRKKNPEKRSAHRALYKAIRYRGLRRGACEVCGCPKTEGHHEDYSMPFLIRWLCRKHHRAMHSKQGLSLPPLPTAAKEKWMKFKFAVGDKTEWASQSRGVKTLKQGVVIEIIPAGAGIGHYIDKHRASHNIQRVTLAKGSRPEESYLVEVKIGGDMAKLYVYWPLVIKLSRLSQADAMIAESVRTDEEGK